MPPSPVLTSVLCFWEAHTEVPTAALKRCRKHICGKRRRAWQGRGVWEVGSLGFIVKSEIVSK